MKKGRREGRCGIWTLTRFRGRLDYMSLDEKQFPDEAWLPSKW